MLRRRSHHFSVLLCLVAVHEALATWTMDLEPYQEACFIVRTLDQPRVLSGNYELVNAHEVSADPLLVYIMEDDKVVWHSKKKSAFDSFHAKCMPDKVYWLCLQNSSHGPLADGDEDEHPDDATRIVGFNYRVHGEPKVAVVQWDADRSEEWLELSFEIADDMMDLQDHQEYNKKRESYHRWVVEKTFTDVLLWTIVEAGMVIFGAAAQVMFYRMYLEKKQTYY